ncbi:hypothetical protein DIPPA_35204 [Diplonema papillatum]|nr:hypothetical protein DIPPA_35204 [Diplonema papillatum]
MSSRAKRERDAAEPVEISRSAVLVSLVLGFVSTQVYIEVTSKRSYTDDQRCPSVIEVENMLRSIGENQYYYKLISHGFDRLDIISESSYEDMKALHVKPYHWARMRAEALKRLSKDNKKVSITSQLSEVKLDLRTEDGQHIGSPPPSQTSHSADNWDRFYNIAPGKYLPEVNASIPVVTALCTASLQDRLSTLLNAMWLAKALNGNIHVLWAGDAECGARFSTIFNVGPRSSVSTTLATHDRDLFSIFDERVLDENFDSVFTTPTGLIANLVGDKAEVIPRPGERWLSKLGRKMSLDPEKSDLIDWAKKRARLDQRVHILYQGDHLAQGVALDEGVTAKLFGFRLSEEVTDLVKKMIDNNDITAANTVAVYHADLVKKAIPEQQMAGKKVIVLAPPTQSDSELSGPGIRINSLFAESAQLSSETAVLNFMSMAALLASVPVPVLAPADAATAPREPRPESLLADVLTEIGLVVKYQ